MNFKAKTYKLKNEKSINIRTPLIGEALELINLKRSYIQNTTTIPMYLEEYPIDCEKEKKIISEYEERDNCLLLIAEYNGEFIGNIDLTGSERLKMYHTGMIGMGIKEQWRNLGLGKILINSVIEWAKKYSKIELVWLDVYSSNELGFNLYLNTGFIKSGIMKGFFKENNGYKDKIQMYQRIK